MFMPQWQTNTPILGSSPRTCFSTGYSTLVIMVPLAGADLITGGGMLEASTLLVPEQLIYDDEIYHTHRVLLEGIETSAEALAVDVIRAVGPRGHFLGQRHTRHHLRDIWIPSLTHPRPSGPGHPQLDIQRRAKAQLDRILAEHEPEPLERAAQEELQAILEAAGRELVA